MILVLLHVAQQDLAFSASRPPTLPRYELLSKLLVSPLISPIAVPYTISYITPFKEFRL